MVGNRLMRRNQKQDSTAWIQSDQPEHVVGFLLKSLHHALRQSVDEALRERGVGLSFAHFATLFGLFLEPGIPGAQLARRALVSAQTMNSILRRLEKDGLIERRPHPESRRADSWSLTKQGSEQLARARVIGDAVFSQMLSALSAPEVAQLQGYLRRCIAALEDNTDPRLSPPEAADPPAPIRRERQTGAATADRVGRAVPARRTARFP
jgi:DNA-binding MarR family transcriptional regulator